MIAEAVRTGTPAGFNRVGLVELEAVNRLIKKEAFGRTSVQHPIFRLLNVNAGVYPLTNKDLRIFLSRYMEAIKYSSHVGVLFNFGEPKLLRNTAFQGQLFEMVGIDPFLYSNPWSSALAGKRVVVVSPFAETIERQFAARDLIWPAGVLPDFDLRTVRAPLCHGIHDPVFPTWGEALRWLLSEVERRPYDVLIAGAGAYAPCLASHAFQRGKIGINLGGSTQVLFGIKGRRWENIPEISKHFNSHWTRPSPSETPPQAEAVEAGCYW